MRHFFRGVLDKLLPRNDKVVVSGFAAFGYLLQFLLYLVVVIAIIAFVAESWSASCTLTLYDAGSTRVFGNKTIEGCLRGASSSMGLEPNEGLSSGDTDERSPLLEIVSNILADHRKMKLEWRGRWHADERRRQMDRWVIDLEAAGLSVERDSSGVGVIVHASHP